MTRIEHGAVGAPVRDILPGMGQIQTWVSVHCAQCGDSPASPDGEAYWPPEETALDAAAAEGWRVGPGGRLWCSACAPMLTCEAQGHEFSDWRRPVTRDGHPASSEYRHCRRCCRCDSRPTGSLIEALSGPGKNPAIRQRLLAVSLGAGEVA
jgi:hypothetical protein